ncbi:MAG: tetratricopeptide repeat protein [Treponema sp.]|nr:tetratricopeptide repeat protein [Treponema sp.]
MKTHILHIFAALIIASCSKTPDTQTIRAYSLASEAYARGNFTEVIELLHKQNNFMPSLILRAKSEYFSGDLEKAEKSCRRALKLRPSSFEAGLYLAKTLRDKNNLSEAQTRLESLLADNPLDIRALRLAADLACGAGKFDEAVIYLDRAAELSAESAMVLLDRARISWVAGKGKQALDDLSRAKAMLPWDTPLHRSILNLEKIIKEVM